MRKDLIFKDNLGYTEWYEILKNEEGKLLLLNEQNQIATISETHIDHVRKVRGKNKRVVLSYSEEQADKLLECKYLYRVYEKGYMAPQKITVIGEDEKGFYIQDKKVARLITHELITWKADNKTLMWIPGRKSENRCLYTYSLNVAKQILKRCRN